MKYKNQPQPVKPPTASAPAPQAIETPKLNIYQKLQTIRKEIAESDLQRSSQNTEKGFSYMELADYLPQINKLNAQYGLMTHFNMGKDEAVLKIVDTDNPTETLEWTLPVEGYQMENAEAIQILKGKTTYLRRNLLEIAYEISVKDSVDAKGVLPETKGDELDPRDKQALDEATDAEHLATIANNIKNRKGFTKHKTLLAYYTKLKKELTK